jgi:hypothetical protein
MPTVPSAWSRSLFATIAPQPAKTSTNVATASVHARRASPGLAKELGHESVDARVDLVPDGSHGGQVLTGGDRRVPKSSYRLPGKIGQASPQPIVITTSAARTPGR